MKNLLNKLSFLFRKNTTDADYIRKYLNNRYIKLFDVNFNNKYQLSNFNITYQPNNADAFELNPAAYLSEKCEQTELHSPGAIIRSYISYNTLLYLYNNPKEADIYFSELKFLMLKEMCENYPCQYRNLTFKLTNKKDTFMIFTQDLGVEIRLYAIQA